MLTPQQIQEISFEKVRFGGYDMASVDDILEPLTEDYITLYKENSVLKSKMRILVEKLEEYRKQESSMQSALMAAQKTCDQMVAETEKKCAAMLREAEENASAKTQNVDALVEGEEARLQLAKEASAGFIDSMEKRLNRQLELLEELRKAELPDIKAAESFGKTIPAEQEEKKAFDFEKAPSAPTTQEKADAIIEEIGLHIEESLGAPALDEMSQEAEGTAANVEEPSELIHGVEKPKKFEGLQFGPNYDPTKK